MTTDPNKILSNLLSVDLQYNAAKLGFTSNGTFNISRDEIGEIIDCLNHLSLQKTDLSKRQLIGISSLIWTYAGKEWPGLRDYLVLFLSRAGFGPSSIMVDDGYDRSEKTYSTSTSLINQVSVTVNQSQFEIVIQDKTFLLTSFQKDIWDNIEGNKLMGISAPTSAGKSHVILLKVIDLLIKQPGSVVYVVPTLSLVSQVAQDFRKALTEFNLSQYRIETSMELESSLPQTIYVLTQEKAIGAFSQLDPPISKIRSLVIDEIQNIERVADWEDQRAKVLFDLMIEFKNRIDVDHIIIAGPRIENISELGIQIFDVKGYASETKSSPVMSITYSIAKDTAGYSFKLHSDLLAKPLRIKIDNEVKIEGYGKKQYTPDYLNFLTSFISKIGPNQSNIIFSPTTDISRKIADAIAAKEQNRAPGDVLYSLSDYLSKTVSPNFSLSQTVVRGTAYHHGKLPHHVRTVVEDCIRNQHIKNVVCTTTLLQGVNLPIQNIIIRNPDLVIKSPKSGSPKLTPYEIANLRGRAGRLLKDFIGRTFILNEDSFKETKEETQTSLFKDETKTLNSGYQRRFEEFKDKIKNDLLTNQGQTDGNKEFSYLTTYIRQTILRYGVNSSMFLNKVGISLTDEEIQDTYNLLLGLDLPKELFLNNRYWDPFDLALLRKRSSNLNLPTNIYQAKMAYQLQRVIEFFRDTLPVYFNRYVKVDAKGNRLLSKCITAEGWMKETPLSEILDPQFYKTSDIIEQTIKFVQNDVSFGMPMLFKPLYDIKDHGHFIPRCMELGACRPVTKKLIEFEIPRETAISISRKIGPNSIIDDESLIKEVIKMKPTLSYWEQIQLQTIC